MLAVSNTLPLGNLAIIGRLDFVRGQVGEVVIPRASAHMFPPNTIFQLDLEAAQASARCPRAASGINACPKELIPNRPA